MRDTLIRIVRSHKRLLLVSSVALCLFLLVAAAYILIPRPEPLPSPESGCPIAQSWLGITPGKSRRQDVLAALGSPAEQGNKQFRDWTAEAYFEYPVQMGAVRDFVADRVYFREDGIVDWLQIVVGDRDGRLHRAQETFSRLGNMVDAAYLSNNKLETDLFHKQFDVWGGPDEVYVWAACGTALDTADLCNEISLRDAPLCLAAQQSATPADETPATPFARATLEYPYEDDAPYPKPGSIVVLEILFQPTSFAGFEEHYRFKLPYVGQIIDEYAGRLKP